MTAPVPNEPSPASSTNESAADTYLPREEKDPWAFLVGKSAVFQFAGNVVTVNKPEAPVSVSPVQAGKLEAIANGIATVLLSEKVRMDNGVYITARLHIRTGAILAAQEYIEAEKPTGLIV